VASANDYDSFAEAYSAATEANLVNGYYTRPAILNLAGDVAGRRVLDAGCGSGPLSAAPTSTRRTALHLGPTSASRTRFPDHVFQDAGIGEVAEEHNMTFPDPEDLDGCRRERLARRGHGPLRPQFHNHHLRVLGLVELYHLEVL
jgi:hypothetical protein